MRIPPRIAVAGLTVLTIGSLSHALFTPYQGARKPVSSPAGATAELGSAREAQLENAASQAADYADAINADHLRSAELRPAEKAASSLIEALRKP